jgi:hypothetical protein
VPVSKDVGVAFAILRNLDDLGCDGLSDVVGAVANL